MQIKKKNLFLFQLQSCGSSSACRKKTRCRRMAPVPPFWYICQWQNFPGNLNTLPNTSSKHFFLLPFLQPKKKCPKIYAVTLVLPLNQIWLKSIVWKKHIICTLHTIIFKLVPFCLLPIIFLKLRNGEILILVVQENFPVSRLLLRAFKYDWNNRRIFRRTIKISTKAENEPEESLENLYEVWKDWKERKNCYWYKV